MGYHISKCLNIGQSWISCESVNSNFCVSCMSFFSLKILLLISCFCVHNFDEHDPNILEYQEEKKSLVRISKQKCWVTS